MNALRESPMRPRPKSGPPRWLIIVLVVVGVLVIVGVIYAVVAFLGRSDETATPVAEETATTCVTSTSRPDESLPAAQKVTIRVFNATKKQGLARNVADDLSERGFKVDEVANDEVVRKQTGVAELRYGPKGRRQALLLQYYLPGAELVPDDRKGKIVDVALGETFVSVAPQAEVDIALTTPVVTSVGAGCQSESASQPAAPVVTGGSASE